MQVRDRIKEFRRVKASELKRNPKNWRSHPERQTKVLREIIEQVGFAGAVIAREMDDGSLELIDGEDRCDLAGNQEIPALILDVSQEEADLLLATYDSVGTMAETDVEKLHDLLTDLENLRTGPYTRQMVEDLKDENPVSFESLDQEKQATDVLLDQSIQLRPSREYVVVMCDDDGGIDFENLKSELKLKSVRRGGYKEGSPFDDIGIERVISAKRLLKVLGNDRRNSKQGKAGKGQKSPAGA